MLRIISFFSIVIFLIINIYHYNVSYEVIKLEKKIYKIENLQIFAKNRKIFHIFLENLKITEIDLKIKIFR